MYLSDMRLYQALAAKALRSSETGRYLRFHGSHSIVQFTQTKHGKRARIVLSGLKGIPNLHIEYVITHLVYSGRFFDLLASDSAPIQEISFDAGYRVTYNCVCTSFRTKTMSAASTSASASQFRYPSNHHSKDLSKQTNHNPIESPCGGSISIKISEDLSHPFIDGQRIMIRIHHPTNRPNSDI